jgi:glycosyltransferase involved in cell wall biosynthesis
MSGILVLFHCESNPGFAAASHEVTFFRMAERLVRSHDDIHFAFRTLDGGMSPTLPKELKNVIEFDASSTSHSYLSRIEEYIRTHRITLVFGFDQPVRRKAYAYLRRGGVKHFISYWGAPMSSINQGIKLMLKRLDVLLAFNQPDHYIFQSEGMRDYAVYGRGIPLHKTSIVRTGIDIDRFSPPEEADWYAHDQFNIDRTRKIVFFSGHMEERKGVHIIVKTAVHLVDELGRKDVHFLIVGNKPGQEERFFPLFKKTNAEQHITFGGYRSDVPQLLKSCSIGMIASTGWDSFPMSSVEMAATGLPLVISDLPGLRDAVTRETGMLFPVGDYKAAANRLVELLDDEKRRREMGMKGRQRVLEKFSSSQQIYELERIVRSVAGLPPA